MNYPKVVIAVSLVILVAACGSNAPKSASTTPPPTHASTSATTTTPAPNLNSELLAISDLPSGWTVIGTSNSGVPQCLLNAETDMKATTTAEAAFAYGSSGPPDMDEYLAYLPGQGQSGMAAAAKDLSGCGQISTTVDGQTLTGTIGPLSYPAVADQSSAYQMKLSGVVSGTSATLGIDLVVFRKGDSVAMIFFADLGTPNIQTLEPLVQGAAAKLG